MSIMDGQNVDMELLEQYVLCGYKGNFRVHLSPLWLKPILPARQDPPPVVKTGTSKKEQRLTFFCKPASVL